MDHRSSVTRHLRWTHPALGLLGLAALALAGCRSNAQQDLIARELRMQEDQLYAMEDYISQYQQLVCKYRSENAALRRQLGTDDDKGVEVLPVPSDETRPRAERRGPTFRAPQTPRRNDPAPDEIQIEVPGVPPLESSTSTQVDSTITTASYDESIESGGEGEAASAATEESTTHPPQTDDIPPSPVSLRGEVIANDAGGGPRLMVDIERLDSAGGAMAFDGTLSLLLLERNEREIPQSLARWDFSEDDIRSAIEPSAGEHAMRFYLELPADTPINDGAEIWVRLIPRNGSKLLAHAAIDLQQPGEFSSGQVTPPTGTPEPSTAITESSPRDMPSIAAGKGEWTTARTEQLADLAKQTDAGKWRASSSPMPVVQSSFATAPVSRPIQRAAFFDAAQAKKLPRAYKRPTWSPDRDNTDNRTSTTTPSESSSISKRPVWSDSR